MTFARSVSELYGQYQGFGEERNQMGWIKDKWKRSKWKQKCSMNKVLKRYIAMERRYDLWLEMILECRVFYLILFVLGPEKLEHSDSRAI